MKLLISCFFLAASQSVLLSAAGLCSEEAMNQRCNKEDAVSQKECLQNLLSLVTLMEPPMVGLLEPPSGIANLSVGCFCSPV
jgi:hypothetical protein